MRKWILSVVVFAAAAPLWAGAAPRMNFILKGYHMPPETEAALRDGVDRIVRVHEERFGLSYPPGLEVDVRVYGRFQDFKRYQKATSKAQSNSGYYSIGRREIVVWAGSSPEKLSRIVFHEANHFLLRNRLPDPPKWVNEGLSEYFEYMQVRPGETHFARQGPKLERCRRRLADGRLMGLKESLSLAGADWDGLNRSDDKIASSMSWSLVYFLLSSEEKGAVLRGLIQTLSQDSSVDPAQVIQALYGGGVEGLERDWHAWMSSSQDALVSASPSAVQ
ncbi:MAG: DUF1570 domain-containing protein [Elusimicrobiota bacterium]